MQSEQILLDAAGSAGQHLPAGTAPTDHVTQLSRPKYRGGFQSEASLQLLVLSSKNPSRLD